MQQGVTRYELEGDRWKQTSRGFYVPAFAVASTTQRIVEATPLIPATGALGAWAAAYVLGADHLDGFDPVTFDPLPIPLVRGSKAGHIPRDWIQCSYDHLDPDEVRIRHGIRVTAELRTVCDGMRFAVSVEDAVAFVDACAHCGLIEIRELSRYCLGRRWRGIRQARKACELADAASRSPWESRLRVFYVLSAGLPRPLVNKPVFGLDGRLIAIPDLLDPDAGLVTEFDGRAHRKRRQHRADNVREEALEALGLTVVRADSIDMLWHRDELDLRLQQAHRRGLGRDKAKTGGPFGSRTGGLKRRECSTGN